MSARQGWSTLVTASTVAVILASCSGQGDAPQTTTAAATATTAPAATTQTPPTPDALAACALIADGFGEGDGSIIERIPGSLTSIESTITQDQIDELLDINATLDEAIEIAPTDLAAALTSLKVPFQQAQDVMDAGGGSLHMDTADVTTDLTDVLSLCVDAGYTVNSNQDTTETNTLAADVEEAVTPWPSVTDVTETEPGRIDITTTITDPRGDNGSPEAQEAIAICQAAVDAGATYVAVYEADGTHFVLYGHPLVPAGECAEV